MLIKYKGYIVHDIFIIKNDEFNLSSEIDMYFKLKDLNIGLYNKYIYDYKHMIFINENSLIDNLYMGTITLKEYSIIEKEIIKQNNKYNIYFDNETICFDNMRNSNKFKNIIKKYKKSNDISIYFDVV